MTELSPAAQAIKDAFDSEFAWSQALAAALRAAADQVVPIRLLDEPDFTPGSCCERVLKQERAEMRGDLLAIADELEAQ